MSIRDLKGKVNDRILVENVLVSVSDKSGLEMLVPRLIGVNSRVRFMSTGGTYDVIKDILGNSYGGNLIGVVEYTDLPEMDGGVVKTLHPKIYAGLLGERNNPKHQRYLREEVGEGVFIDLVVVNLYPFEEMVRRIEAGEIDPKTGDPYNFESARGNVDVGGPTMLRAAAKNFPSCASVCDPKDYLELVQRIEENGGATSFNQRLNLAPKVFETTAKYDAEIAKYLAEETLNTLDIEAIRGLYKFSEE